MRDKYFYEVMYRKPATTFNQKAEALYQQNVLSVMEEVWHKEGERIDLVIFLNGIAIFTFELKCNTSGQNYEDAIRQYIIVVDRGENGSEFKRLNEDELEIWLEDDYALGDLWKKNILGGRLSK